MSIAGKFRAMSKVVAVREHEIAAGHRVVGHEGKCCHLHGHGYVFKFTCEADGLDNLGRVIDFGIIKSTLCQWLEEAWDHRFLLWDLDPLRAALVAASKESVVAVPFNPTAENMALHLLNVVGPKLLGPFGVRLIRVEVRETRKCSAEAAV